MKMLKWRFDIEVFFGRGACAAQYCGLIPLFFFLPLMAQNQAQLYAGLVKSNGYVAGVELAASGLHRYDGDQTWTHLGWNHPRVNAIACDPTNPQIIFLACGDGAARTNDGGKSWRAITDWRITEAQDICVDPNAPQQVYLATAYGVWRSQDHGETWTESNVGLIKKFTHTIAVDRAPPRRILAGTEGGLYLATESVASWSLIGPEEVAVLDLEQSFCSPSIWLAATQDRGVLLSHDNGKTWQSSKGKIARAEIYAVASDPFNAQHLAAASWGEGMLVSEDEGQSWQLRVTGLPTRNLYETVFDANRAGRLWAATFEEGIFYSDDLGRTWHGAGMSGAIVFDMVFIER